MKKNLLWMLAAILACGASVLSACSDDMADNPVVVEQVAYSVNGISDCNGQMVYLMNMTNEKTIDSVKIVDGKFSFSGLLDKDAMMGIGLNKFEVNCWITLFFNDGTPVTANLHDSTLVGSPLNTCLSYYDIEVYRPYFNLQRKVMAMSEEEIAAKEEEIMEALIQIDEDITAMVNQIFIDERNTLIPLAFAIDYFYGNGIEAYDKLIEEGVIFANHPYLKYARDKVAAMDAE